MNTGLGVILTESYCLGKCYYSEIEVKSYPFSERIILRLHGNKDNYL